MLTVEPRHAHHKPVRAAREFCERITRRLPLPSPSRRFTALEGVRAISMFWIILVRTPDEDEPRPLVPPHSAAVRRARGWPGGVGTLP